MEFIFFGIGGFLGGFVFAIIHDLLHNTYGVIDIDHDKNVCQFHITSEELANRKTKQAIFTINHKAHISREEQTL